MLVGVGRPRGVLRGLHLLGGGLLARRCSVELARLGGPDLHDASLRILHEEVEIRTDADLVVPSPAPATSPPSPR